MLKIILSMKKIFAFGLISFSFLACDAIEKRDNKLRNSGNQDASADLNVSIGLAPLATSYQLGPLAAKEASIACEGYSDRIASVEGDKVTVPKGGNCKIMLTKIEIDQQLFSGTNNLLRSGDDKVIELIQVGELPNGLQTNYTLRWLIAYDRFGGKIEGNSGLTCTEAEVGKAPLRRLTKIEYANTLTSILGVDNVKLILANASAIPDDSNSFKFNRMDNSLSQQHIDSYYSIATSVTDFLVANPPILNQYVPCREGSNVAAVNDTCFTQFVYNILEKFHRRPADVAKVTKYSTGLKDSNNNESIRRVIKAALLSPDFLYHVETTGTLSNGDLTLDSFSQINRLAYFLTSAPPDAQLTNLARNAGHIDHETLKNEAERLINSNQFKTNFASFLEQWLEIERPHLPPSDRDFNSLNLSGTQKIEAENSLQTDVTESLFQEIFLNKVDFLKLMTTDLSFVNNSSVARIYGLSSSFSGFYRHQDDRRHGIITRPAFNATASHDTGLIHRAFIVRNALLCENFVLPEFSEDQQAKINQVQELENLTSREKWTTLTSDPACIGCHARMNPAGFALEGIDSFGRIRDAEKLYTKAGVFLRNAALNLVVKPLIDSESDPEVDGAAELAMAIGVSSTAKSCFVKQWNRFALRDEPSAKSQCGIDKAASQLTQGQSVYDVLIDTIVSEVMLKKTIE